MKQSEVLIDFIAKNNIKTMAEIGVWKSHTTKKILKSESGKIIQNYWAIDLWKVLNKDHGRMSKLKQSEWDKLYKKACILMTWYSQLHVIRMSSKEASEIFNLKYFQGYFDLVYLDASHFKNDVINDITYWLPLVKRNGYIGGHDYGMGYKKGHRIKEAVLHFYKEKELELYSDGVWLKKVG